MGLCALSSLFHGAQIAENNDGVCVVASICIVEKVVHSKN